MNKKFIFLYKIHVNIDITSLEYRTFKISNLRSLGPKTEFEDVMLYQSVITYLSMKDFHGRKKYR